MDRGYIERNEASRARLRALLDRLTDDDLRQRVGEWTVAMSLAHLAFWDRFGQLRWIETFESGRDLPVQVGSPLTDPSTTPALTSGRARSTRRASGPSCWRPRRGSTHTWRRCLTTS
jgi:hypothetical protein